MWLYLNQSNRPTHHNRRVRRPAWGGGEGRGRGWGRGGGEGRATVRGSPVTGTIDPALRTSVGPQQETAAGGQRRPRPAPLPPAPPADAASERAVADWARPVTSWLTHFQASGRSPLPLFQYFYRSASGGLVSVVSYAAHRQRRYRRGR